MAYTTAVLTYDCDKVQKDEHEAVLDYFVAKYLSSRALLEIDCIC